jgi:signal recognition particle receptor subunit beta
VKIAIAGGFGAGKTTLINTVSEIPGGSTEALITTAAAAVDDLDARLRPGKTTTTVAMDFGRITTRDGLTIYLFGTPGQPRFWPLWDQICRGAIAAVVLIDPRRIDDSFPVLNYVEGTGLPHVVVVNQFGGALPYALEEIRAALNVQAALPVLAADVRDRDQVKHALAAAVGVACTRATATASSHTAAHPAPSTPTAAPAGHGHC